jgi:hypothetical protein
MKILNTEEINKLIEGIENGDIVIDSSDMTPMTPEDHEEYKKLRQERVDAMTYDEKEEMKKLIEKLRKEDESTSNKR